MISVKMGLIGCVFFFNNFAEANPQAKPQVSLHIQLDRSASVFGTDPFDPNASVERGWLYPMEKIRGLASEIVSIMKNSRCEYEISVGGILYNDADWNSLEPFAQKGTPQVITRQMDEEYSAHLIQQRLTNPTFSDPEVPLPYGSSEILYTSSVEFIRQYQKRFVGKKVVGTLLISDAGPAFESYTPQEALEEIWNLLDEETIYVPGALAYPFLSDANHGKNTSLCQRDPDVQDGEGLIEYNPETHEMKYFSWEGTQVLDLHRFNQMGRGYTWDICSKNYEESLRDFLIMLLDAGRCNLNV